MWEHAHQTNLSPKPRHSIEQTDEGAAWARHVGIRHLAYGETVAPPQVDTLRDENCPICGEEDAYDGTRCPVCSYVAPPSPFNDPDLGLASRIDLRQQQDAFDATQVTDPERMDEQADGGTLICPSCGTEFPQEPPESVDTDEAAPDVSAEETEVGEGAAEGDVCPACGQGVLTAKDTLDDEAAEEGDVSDAAEPDEQDAPPFGKAETGEDEQEPEDEDESDDDEEDLPGVPVKSSDGPVEDEDDDEDEDDKPVPKKRSKDKQ